MDSTERKLRQLIRNDYEECRKRGEINMADLARATGYSRSKLYRMMSDTDSTEVTWRFLRMYARTVKGLYADTWLAQIVNRAMSDTGF